LSDALHGALRQAFVGMPNIVAILSNSFPWIKAWPGGSLSRRSFRQPAKRRHYKEGYRCDERALPMEKKKNDPIHRDTASLISAKIGFLEICYFFETQGKFIAIEAGRCAAFPAQNAEIKNPTAG
jgi:hypothetical protein